MQKLQDSVFSIVKTTNLSPAVFSFLQPSEDYTDKTPLGGILKDTKHGWLALGPKFCVVDLRTGLKVAAHTFGTPQSTANTSITCVVELPRPLTPNSIQLVISLQSEDSGIICVLHVSGSQLLRCIQTEVVVTQMALSDHVPDGPFTCFDGVVMVGSKSGEIFAFDLNRSGLIQALKDISQGYDHLIRKESNPVNLTFLHYNALHRIQEQREIAIENEDHLAVLLNENSLVDSQYIFRNPDGTVRMKAKRDHIRVTVLQYIPQLASLAVGYNFGAFQIWNIMSLELEFTSQVNVECLPVTQFGFQEPCDDPRAFCYLWVVFSVIDRFEEEEFPLAVMYSLTYQGKRMLSDTKVLYQEFSMATLRFQLELSSPDEVALLGGKCVSCHTYSINSTLAAEGEDSMLNICQIVWECWGENAKSSTQYGMLLFDLDQWYKDQMPASWRLESNAFMSVTWCSELSLGACVTLDVRLDARSLSVYSHATRLEEHFYPNSLQYSCICLNTSEACVLNTIGIQRQIISSLDEVGPTVLLNPTRLYHACVTAGLTPLYVHTYTANVSQEEQRKFLLSVALEAKLSRLLKRCAHDWAAGSHAGVGCTLTFLVDWCWSRAIELKENATELTAPLFSSAALPDRNVIRCLEHCVQQLTQLSSLLDSVLTKCCNLIIPDALTEIEEKFKGIGTVSLYFQVVQWFLRVGLLPERQDTYNALPYPEQHLYSTYTKRRLKLNRIQDNTPSDESDSSKPCPLLYIDQLIENEFDGDRIRELWQVGSCECSGLYPPPSLYALLRLYLLPDIADEHKHSLVLYLLVDYSMVYDDVRYESVIRRLMQFPTMFGLSNTAIKATQAFWHLDHRDFDFALDQLQCLTGNTLSDWQHNVVLSTLLAQNKTQSALQYLHVRKPAPIHMRNKDGDMSRSLSRVNEHDKLEDWRSCCNLYLARGLVFQALDVIRTCVLNAGAMEDKVEVLKVFFRGCRHTGNLPKVLQLNLSQLEEEVFVKYLEECNDTHSSDILVMYYLQQSRYVEAECYNNKIKQNKPRSNDICTSSESLFDIMDRETTRDAIVEVVCSSLPSIATKVAHYALDDKDIEPHVIVPKPMSVYVKAKSPKNTFIYKSSFIQESIENASETWMNRPKMRRGLKRALNVEETPFICTPKVNRTWSISFQQKPSESTPPKRARLDLTGTPKTRSCTKLSDKLSREMATLLNMPDIQSPDCKLYERSGAETPHSILKIRRNEAIERAALSPVDSRYLDVSDDELLETASNQTHYSDSTNKHLRFTIPTASESGSTPSPVLSSISTNTYTVTREKEIELDLSTEPFTTTASHPMTEKNPLESPPKKMATEESNARKSFKDTVRARRSLSISINSSLSDDPNTSIESIADIPITLINPRYSGEKRHKLQQTESVEQIESEDNTTVNITIEVPKTPKGRRSIRGGNESTPLVNRSRSVTPDRQDSPTVTPTRGRRGTRSRSRTPELSPRMSPLAPIIELPKQETECEPHPVRNTLTVRQLRSKSRTPERKDKMVGSPRLEAITESPTKSSESSTESPTRRSLRSRSRTPEVEIQEPAVPTSPRSLRRRAKTPEKIMSPKLEHSARSKKPLSRLVLEHNTFSKTKLLGMTDTETEPTEKSDSAIECTPMKAVKQVPSLMDVTLSPITNKSILPSSADTTISETSQTDIKTSKESKHPAFTTIHETFVEKSVLHSYQSSIGDTSISIHEEKIIKQTDHMKSLPAFTLNETEFNKSVLHSYESSVAESSSIQDLDESKSKNVSKPFTAFVEMMKSDFDKSVLCSAQSSIAESSGLITDDSKQQASSLLTNDSDVEMQEKEDKTRQDTAEKIEKEKIVEIEREINELEGDMDSSEGSSGDSDESGSGEENEEEIEEEEIDEEAIESGLDESSSSNEVEDVINLDSDTDEEDRLQIVEQQEEPTNEDPNSNDSGTPTVGQPKIDTVKEVVQIENVELKTQQEDIEIESSVDPLNQGQMSLLTDDNTVDSDKSDLNLNYSNEDIDVYEGLETPMETETASTKETNLPEPTKVIEAPKVESKDTEDNKTPIEETNVKVVKMDSETSEKEVVHTEITPTVSHEVETKIQPTTSIVPEPVETKIQPTTSIVPEPVETKIQPTTSIVPEPVETSPKPVQLKEQEKESVINKEKLPKTKDKTTENTKDTEKSEEKEIKPARRTRGRSNSSNISAQDEIKTPVTRKRTQSNASAKSTEQNTQETESRSKTPTTEVRKIITRRVSREMSGKDDVLEETLTPKRSTRSRSKFNDNDSVVSDSSVVSNKSKVSEEGDRASVRKGRKSVVASKPELSVIPEVTMEEKTSENIIDEYSSSRRLTRHQKSVLESWLEPSASPRRRASTTSRHSKHSVASEDDDTSPHSAFDVQPIDRISLLNKTDFEGSPDADELQSNLSPESILSDASKQRKHNTAASETKSTPKAAKIHRRISVDVGESPDTSRGRRASFTRACEALNTPKGRRTSTDLRKGETESPEDSLSSSVVAGRRTRRAASTQSNSSVTSSDLGKRSKKTVEESKDSKKK